MNNELKNKVKETYKNIVEESYDKKELSKENQIALSIGYTLEDIESMPYGMNLGLSCGNPFLYTKVKEGERVLDLGSGAGFDSFLALKKVGESGYVIGVDMLDEMVNKAKSFIKEEKNIDFRVGIIENLPVEDNSIDLIISNCVVNLSLDKKKVYDECFRVLKPGGRICISDIVRYDEIPEEVKQDDENFCNWVTGASSVDELKKLVKSSGFRAVTVTEKLLSKEYINRWGKEQNIDEFVRGSITRAVK